jgi:uncharacterized protein (TIGR02270 family)
MNVLATSPAHAPAREARAQIDAIAAGLRESTSALDRRGIADRLTRAIRALYAVIDTSLEAPAHHDGLVECGRVLTEARQMLAAGDPRTDPALGRALAALDATIARVRRSAEEVADVILARRADLLSGLVERPQAKVRSFQASIGMPTLHRLTRAPVAPSLDVEPTVAIRTRSPRRPAPPKPQTLEELRAMAAAARAFEPSQEQEPELAFAPVVRAPDEGEILRRLARDCLEDIAALRMLRVPIPTETWLDQAPFEQRLLDNIDAFVALGEAALPSVTLFHAEAPAPDPARGFAVALTLGCIEGTDTVDTAVATMKQSAPEELPGFAEGFILAPSPAIDPELARLLDAPNPALVAAALEIHGARGSLPVDATERVLPRKDPILTAKLAAALGRAGPRTKAVTALTELLDRDPSDALFEIACEALLRRGDGGVRQRLRDAIRARSSPDRVRAATRLLALAGRREDVAVLLDGVSAQPSAESIRALGRFGHVETLPALMALLDAKEEDIVTAAAEALDFVTNAGLRETKQLPWTPGVDPPDGSPPPTRAVSVVIADRLAWERWYVRESARLDPRIKHRGGVPFTPSMIVAELAAATTPVPRRAEAALELVIATGVGTRFSTIDWVARQKRQLSELEGHVRSLGSTAGAWWYAGAAAT